MTELQRYQYYSQLLSSGGVLLHTRFLLKRAAKQWPEHVAIRCEHESITYQELFAQASQFAHRLLKIGVKPHDRVALYCENSIAFVVAYYGIWQAGAIVVPLNTFFSSSELSKIIQEVEPKAVIISPTLQEKLTTPLAVAVIISSTDVMTPKDQLDGSSYVSDAPQDDQDLVALLYTSGTTGFPKGVMLTSRNIMINALQAIARFNRSHDLKLFCPLPLFHCLPQNLCLWSSFAVGGTSIIVPKIERKTLLEGLAQKPGVVVGVPALFGIFCLMKTLDLESVKFFVSGGDALSDKTRQYFSLLYRRKICNGYGMTEASPFISIDMDDYLTPTSCIGHPLIGMEVQIRDENNLEVLDGEIGTIWLKGENIMKGYYKAPEATAKILQYGWLCTGDLAKKNQEGKLILAGREKDLIVHKGLKIYPQEIENILLTHKEVLQAAVLGEKKDEQEFPVAFIATKAKNHATLITQLQDLVGRSLAAYKHPSRYIIKTELPVTATGKVDKKILVQEL